jgi:hypothetical protein
LFKDLGEKMSNEAKAAAVDARPKRRLSDLYVVGEEVVFDDGTDDPIVVWLQKLTPTETQAAVDAARPAKSIVASIKRLPEDDPAKAPFYDELDKAEMLSKMDKMTFLVKPKVDEFKISAEYRIADEDEWAKDDYLIGLQTAWGAELRDRWLEDPTDPEADRVYKELVRYNDQVEAETEAEKNELIYEIQDLSEQEIDRRVVNRLIEDYSSKKMIDEFRMQQIFLATREVDDHSKRYFNSREELDILSSAVINKLLLTYAFMAVDPMEGKD